VKNRGNYSEKWKKEKKKKVELKTRKKFK